MKTVLLAGGLGTRLMEETTVRPKPMVEVGGHPILWHIMSIYASFSFTEFVVALGYKGEVVKDYFAKYFSWQHDLTVSLGSGEVTIHRRGRTDWKVHLVDTGQLTETGGRLRRLRDWLGHETFMMTYGDGVADINLHELLAFHRAAGRLATVTAVRPPARFGSLAIDGDRVTCFTEKPQVGEGWINGGFFVLEPAVLDYIPDDATKWELQPLQRLAEAGQLAAFRHHGFWQPMDTLRDRKHLESLWEQGKAPWKSW